MIDSTRGPARDRLSARTRIDYEEFERLQTSGALALDDRRRRPLYFDGRFLTAADLTRDQQYFLAREAALGRAVGSGVAAGLQVRFDAARERIVIDPGHGVTGGGEPVVIPSAIELDPQQLGQLRAFEVRLTNLPEQQRLDTAFGLGRIPAEPGRVRSGLFILALRPVEYTASPITAYPTSINGRRTVEDGDIVEATAITLIPYYADTGAGDLNERRARAAYDMFVGRAARDIGDQVLPLAMIALDQLEVRWVDPFLVRREIGAEHADVLGLGFAPRAAREAFAVQYDRHLAEVLALRGPRAAFAASEHFFALPPVGRMPAGAISPADFTQTYFPPEMSVDLSIIPDDEIAALIAESLLLPPLDLSLAADAQESTSVLVLVAVPRRELRRLKNTLTSLSRTLRAAAPGLVARRTPIEALSFIRGIRPVLAAPQPAPDLVEDTWRALLNGAETLWYARRRNLASRSEVVGTNLWLYSNEVADEAALDARLATFGLGETVATLKGRGSTAADAELVSTLMSPRFAASRMLTAALVNEMQARLIQLDRDNPTIPIGPIRPRPIFPRPGLPGGPIIIRPIGGLDPRRISDALRDAATPAAAGDLPVGGNAAIRLSLADLLEITERYADPHLGEGLDRLQALRADLRDDAPVDIIAQSSLVPELDRMARKLDAATLDNLAEALAQSAATNDAAQVHTLIEDRLKEVPQ